MKINSVVVLYNPNESEIENINTYIDKVECVYVIDNSIEDNLFLIEKLVTPFHKVHYVHNVKNVGLCKALNQGVELSIEAGSQWTVVFDADSRMLTDIFEVYRHTIENYEKLDDVAVFAPQHSFDRRKKSVYVGFREVDWAMTSGWLINNEIFKKLHGFFEPLFVDGLDLDYCYYAKEKGFKIVECGEAVLDHKPAISKEYSFLNKKIQLGTASPFRYYLQAKCLVWDYKRYHKLYDVKMYFIKWAKVLLFFDDKKNYVKNLIIGTKDGIKIYKEYKYGIYPYRE